MSEIYKFVSYVLYKEDLYTMKEIGELLGYTANTISKAIKDIEHRVWVSNEPNDHYVYDVSYDLIKARSYIEKKDMKLRLKWNKNRLKIQTKNQ